MTSSTKLLKNLEWETMQPRRSGDSSWSELHSLHSWQKSRKHHLQYLKRYCITKLQQLLSITSPCIDLKVRLSQTHPEAIGNCWQLNTHKDGLGAVIYAVTTPSGWIYRPDDEGLQPILLHYTPIRLYQISSDRVRIMKPDATRTFSSLPNPYGFPAQHAGIAAKSQHRITVEDLDRNWELDNVSLSRGSN